MHQLFAIRLFFPEGISKGTGLALENLKITYSNRNEEENVYRLVGTELSLVLFITQMYSESEEFFNNNSRPI